MDVEKIKEIKKLSAIDKDAIMKKLYRKFTNQIMKNLEDLGAP